MGSLVLMVMLSLVLNGEARIFYPGEERGGHLSEGTNVLRRSDFPEGFVFGTSSSAYQVRITTSFQIPTKLRRNLVLHCLGFLSLAISSSDWVFGDNEFLTDTQD